MKNKNGFAVSYNPQTAVDSETHLIRDFEMTNQVTDHGMLSPTMEGIKSDTPAEGKPEPIHGTSEEMQERAKEGYFVRDQGRNLVYCPAGEKCL